MPILVPPLIIERDIFFILSPLALGILVYIFTRLLHSQEKISHNIYVKIVAHTIRISFFLTLLTLTTYFGVLRGGIIISPLLLWLIPIVVIAYFTQNGKIRYKAFWIIFKVSGAIYLTLATGLIIYANMNLFYFAYYLTVMSLIAGILWLIAYKVANTPREYQFWNVLGFFFSIVTFINFITRLIGKSNRKKYTDFDAD